jgi:RNA polymerase sigma factor (TIGR02999 family)
MLVQVRIMMPSSEEITVWLARWQNGDPDAREQVFGIVHSRLREIAAKLLQGQRPDHTLEPNALVNELCVRLFGSQKIDYNDRGHFFAAAAQTMRRILIDYARAGLAEKRGGDKQRVSLSGIGGLTPVALNEDMLALDAALSKLATLDPRAAQVVELRFFAGLEEEQVAEVLGVSAITVKRDWKAARAWLAGQLSPANRVPQF